MRSSGYRISASACAAVYLTLLKLTRVMLDSIHKDKIGDVSIRVGSSDETWTRALRHVLLDLKILLADSCR